jgi:DNA polymerase-3 subunit epsilon
MSHNFTAIDFETAHGKRWSICQVGLVRVENGITIEQFSVLVQPPNNFYWDNFIDIHGITPDKTENVQTFDEVWHQMEPFIKNQNVVAHNGYYEIEPPKYTGYCTYRIFGENLASLCQKYRIPLNHHDALSDALACAELYKLYLKQ